MRTIVFKPELHLTLTEHELLVLLYRRELISSERAADAIYAGASREVDGVNNIKVIKHRLQEKLRARGIAIETSIGRGWWLTRGAKQALSSFIINEPERMSS